MDPPEGEINESEWLKPDRTPWLNEVFSLPPDRTYEPITALLLEEAHAAEFLTNEDIEALGTDFSEIFKAVVEIIDAEGVNPQKQFKEWDLFELRSKTE